MTELLANVPREGWAERDEYGGTLLHHACRGHNVAAVVALLRSGLLDVNARTARGTTPALIAASFAQPRVLEVLCSVGADLRTHNMSSHAPIDCALARDVNRIESVRALVANGVRLSTVREDYRQLITPELEAFERGVLRCRAAAVALLRVKKAAKLHHVDKFLMRELAYATWSTRTSERWQE